MRALTNTNIMVDDFDFCKEFPKQTFIHFLSHFHQDHYDGMSTKWSFGRVFSTKVSKTLILQKFTKIPFVTSLEYNTKYTLDLKNQKIIGINDIYYEDQFTWDNQDPNSNSNDIIIQELDENQQLEQKQKLQQILKETEFYINVHLFDAFHIPGSAMFLFQGYNGTILHTGDFRFNQKMIDENPILFPPNRRNQRLKNIAIHVDEMIFDNTYCNPYFDFPRGEVVFDRMKDIINQNSGKRVYIAMGALGKEDICVKLSKYFQTLLIIREDKLEQLKSINYNTEIFTTDKDKGFIEIIRKSDRDVIIEEQKQKENQDFICITTDFLMLDHKDPDGINYTVPYSLHSNWIEMKSLVKAVNPSILRRLVLEIYKLPEFKRNQKIDFVDFYWKYCKNIMRRGESGYSQLKMEHSDITTISPTFKKYMNKELQLYLQQQLKIDTQDKNLRKRRNKEIEEDGPYIPTGKESLQQIAERMMSTNNNKTITSFMGLSVKNQQILQQKQQQKEQQYQQQKQQPQQIKQKPKNIQTIGGEEQQSQVNQKNILKNGECVIDSSQNQNQNKKQNLFSNNFKIMQSLPLMNIKNKVISNKNVKLNEREQEEQKNEKIQNQQINQEQEIKSQSEKLDQNQNNIISNNTQNQQSDNLLESLFQKFMNKNKNNV